MNVAHLIFLFALSATLVHSQSDRRLIQRRRDAIKNWIRRIRSSKRGYSLSPSWSGKSPYHVPSIASLPLQTEPDNLVSNTLPSPTRRFKRKRVQDTEADIGPKFPPNFDELNFDGFGQDLELTDFEGNPLKTADFHPDADDGSPITHKDPYASFDSGFGGFKEDYPFPTPPPPIPQPTLPPSDKPPTKNPLELTPKYPYRNHQEISLNEEVNKVAPRRPFIPKNKPIHHGFKSPSYPPPPYKTNEDNYTPYHPYHHGFNNSPIRSSPSPHYNYRFTPHVNYRPPIGQFEHYNSGYRGGGGGGSTTRDTGDSFFDTFDAFGPTDERRLFSHHNRRKLSDPTTERIRKKNSINSSRRRFKPNMSPYDDLVPILTPKEDTQFLPTVSAIDIASSTSSTQTPRSTTTSRPITSTTSRPSTTTRPIPTPGPFDFPPAPPRRSRPPIPTHPPIITHPPHLQNHPRRTKDYSFAFSDFDNFDTSFESMKIRNKRDTELYDEYEYDDDEDDDKESTQVAERRFGKIGSDFWSDANIEYDYFDKSPQPSFDDGRSVQEELNYRFKGDNSYRQPHSVYPSSNYDYNKGYSTTTYVKSNNDYNGNTYFTQNDLPSTKNKEILGSGNFDVLTGGIFDDFNTRRSYSGSGYTRNGYSNSYSTSYSPYSSSISSGSSGTNPRNNYEVYDIDPTIRFASFKDFASIKRRRPY